MKGRTEFAAKLRKAAENGPSAKIDKDLHQLRYVLGLLHELGILDQLTDADRYELFCHEPARVKVVVASVMQPTVEYGYPANASL
jgi:hypothetical protein